MFFQKMSVGRIRSAIADVVDDRSRKQVHILLHNTDFIAQILQFHIADILSIQ